MVGIVVNLEKCEIDQLESVLVGIFMDAVASSTSSRSSVSSLVSSAPPSQTQLNSTNPKPNVSCRPLFDIRPSQSSVYCSRCVLGEEFVVVPVSCTSWNVCRHRRTFPLVIGFINSKAVNNWQIDVKFCKQSDTEE